MKFGDSLPHRRFILVLAMAVTLGPWSRAASLPPAVPLDPKVREVLSGAIAFYQARTSFEADLASTTRMEMTGMKQQMDSTFHLARVKTGAFALVGQSGLMCGSVYSDGKTLISYQPILHQYRTSKLPVEGGNVLSQVNLTLAEGGLPLGFEALLQKAPLNVFAERLKSSQDLGSDTVGTAPAHHVRLVAPPYTSDLWFATGPQPVLLQATVRLDLSSALKNLPEKVKKKMPAGFEKMTNSRTTIYSNWKFDQPIAPDTFVFHPPADAKLVKDNPIQLPPNHRHTDVVVPSEPKAPSTNAEPATVP